LHNVVRHAKAKNVQITFSLNPDSVVLTLKDDGQGFQPEREKGLGLLGMEERVTHLRGDFRVDSRPGQGTSIRVELPLTEGAVPTNA
jgi:signal transduction histidine kinase